MALIQVRDMESQAENGLRMERRDWVPEEEEAKAGYQLDVRNKREEGK